MNVITVTAGNYKMKGGRFGGGAVEPSAALARRRPVSADSGSHRVRAAANRVFTAATCRACRFRSLDADRASRRRSDGEARSSHRAQRLGDSGRPRLGGDADGGGRRGDPRDSRRAVRGGVCTDVHVRSPATSAGSPGCTAPTCICRDPPPWTFTSGRFFNAGEQSRASRWSCSAASPPSRLFGTRAPIGRGVTHLEPAVPRRRRRLQHDWTRAGAGRRPVRRRLRAAHDGPPAAEPDEAEQHHHHGASAGEVSRLERRHEAPARTATDRREKPDDFIVTTQARGARQGGCDPTSRARSPATSPGSRR